MYQESITIYSNISNNLKQWLLVDRIVNLRVLPPNTLWIKSMSSYCGTAIRWIPQNTFDGKSTLLPVMAWYYQATSHYLIQCWHRSVSLYGITRPQWIKQYHKTMNRNRCYTDCVSHAQGLLYFEASLHCVWCCNHLKSILKFSNQISVGLSIPPCGGTMYLPFSTSRFALNKCVHWICISVDMYSVFFSPFGEKGWCYELCHGILKIVNKYPARYAACEMWNTVGLCMHLIIGY